MWPETVQGAKDLVEDMTARAAKFGRTLKYGFRAMSSSAKPKPKRAPMPTACCRNSTRQQGEAIRNKSLDTQTFGVAHQAELREAVRSQ